MEIFIWLSRLADLLWNCGFTGLKALVSPQHAMAVANTVVLCTQNLSTRERSAVFAFLAIESNKLDHSDFVLMAERMTRDSGIVTMKHDALDLFNLAVHNLGQNAQFRAAMHGLTLTERVDESEKPLQLPKQQLSIPNTGVHIDVIGRRELLEKLYGENAVEQLAYRLADCGVTARIDIMIHQGCSGLSDPGQHVLRTLFGINHPKLDCIALMQERACHFEIIQRERDSGLKQLVANGVARDVHKILSAGQCVPQPA